MARGKSRRKLSQNEMDVIMAIKACSPNANGARVEDYLTGLTKANPSYEFPRSSIYATIISLLEKGHIKSGTNPEGKEVYYAQESGISALKEHFAVLQQLRDAARLVHQYSGIIMDLIKFFRR